MGAEGGVTPKRDGPEPVNSGRYGATSERRRDVEARTSREAPAGPVRIDDAGGMSRWAGDEGDPRITIAGRALKRAPQAETDADDAQGREVSVRSVNQRDRAGEPIAPQVRR